MKILHLAAGNRWTGAAAPAFAEVEALRAAGIDAHYAYVGGYRLQTKLARHGFAHPIIAKAQNPVSFLRTASVLENFVAQHGIDIIHAHLTYDHFLARWAARGRPRVRIARTFHSERTLRNDPFTRSLVNRTDAIFIINDTLARSRVIRDREVTYTPPPLDSDQFTADGPNVRAKYGLADDTLVVTVIGKLSKDRGFEAALETFAEIRRALPVAKLLLIGHGEHRPALEEYTRSLSIEDAVVWAGYHEDDLAEHYRSADVLLFTATGSDEGHRAVIEAMGCGVAPAAFPLDGMRAILGDLTAQHMSDDFLPRSLASVAKRLLTGDRDKRRKEVNQRADVFSYDKASRRLIDAYSTVL